MTLILLKVGLILLKLRGELHFREWIFHSSLGPVVLASLMDITFISAVVANVRVEPHFESDPSIVESGPILLKLRGEPHFREWLFHSSLRPVVPASLMDITFISAIVAESRRCNSSRFTRKKRRPERKPE